MSVNAVYAAFASAAMGIISIVFSFLVNVPMVAVVTGAVGMFLGGYTQSYVRITDISGSVRNKLVIIAVIGLFLSVIGFVHSFAKFSF